MNKKFFLKVIFIFLLIFPISFSPVYGLKVLNSGNKLTTMNSVTTADNTLIIQGNSALASLASSGNGTQANPFILENQTIQNTNYSAIGLKMTNIDAYFVVQNFLINVSYSGGIYLQNVQNGLFKDNIIIAGQCGILVNNSFVNTFKNNTIQNFNSDIFSGIELLDSYQNIFMNNFISSFLVGGIGGIVYSGQNPAFQISNSNNNSIINNTLINSYIHLSGNNLSLLEQKTFVNNTINGEPIIVLQNEENKSVPTNAAQIIIINSTLITIQNENIGYSFGINLFFSNNNTITNCSITSPYMGIYVVHSDYTTIKNNNLQYNYISLSISNSTNVNVLNTTFTYDSNIAYLMYSINNTWENNSLISVPRSQFNPRIHPSNGITIENSQNNNFKNNNILNCNFFIAIYNSTNNYFSNNQATNTIDFIYTVQSDNSVFKNNIALNILNVGLGVSTSINSTLINNTINFVPSSNFETSYVSEGIRLLNSSDCLVKDNFIFNANNGLNLYNSNASNFSYNYITTGNIGILVNKSAYNLFNRNNITSNTGYGIAFYNSSGNNIYLNNFINNVHGTSQAYSDSQNDWSNGTYGNYWSDYNGSDSNYDNVGDTPYAIDGPGKNTDPNPLMVLPTLLISLKNQTTQSSQSSQTLPNTTIREGANHGLTSVIEAGLLLGLVILSTGIIGLVIWQYADYRNDKKNTMAKDSKNNSFMDFLRKKIIKKHSTKTKISQLSDDTLQELEKIIEENKG